MENEDLTLHARRLRILCRCMALTHPDESSMWLSEARYFESYLKAEEPTITNLRAAA